MCVEGRDQMMLMPVSHPAQVGVPLGFTEEAMRPVSSFKMFQEVQGSRLAIRCDLVLVPSLTTTKPDHRSFYT